VNVAAGREVSIREIARIVIEAVGRNDKLEPIHMEPRPGDVRRHYADISKAHQILGFQPDIGIASGIRDYVEWLRNQNWDLASLQQQGKIINWRP
jgi:UDP-glucose 4-epimerase